MIPHFENYLEYLTVERQAPGTTIKSYTASLTLLYRFASGRSIDARLLRGFIAHLHDRGNSAATVNNRIAAIRSYFRFLCCEGVLSVSPAAGLRGPRTVRPLPHFLSETDVQRLLAAPTNNRDRAILHVMYSSGMRIAEVVSLNLRDIAAECPVVRGKGDRERQVMIGPAAQEEVKRYVVERAKLLKRKGRQADALFLNAHCK